MPSLKLSSRTAGAVVLILTIAFPMIATAQLFAGTPVKAMTYNVDEGTDFDAIIGVLTNPSATTEDFDDALGQTITEVQSTNPVLRAQLIANAIATAQPDVVGLQEAAVWTFPTGQVDLRQMILDDLVGQQQPYTAIVTVPEFHLSIPGLGVGFADQDVILVRTDELGTKLKITDTSQGHYAAQVPLPASSFLPATSITRGWGYVDARLNGTAFRFITTHLEDGTNTISPVFAWVQALQEIQLVYGPALTPLPVIIGGDFNTVANDPSSVTFLAYQFMLANGFTDAWRSAHGNSSGATCCQEHLQSSTSELTQRLDLVFTRSHVRIVGAQLVGDGLASTDGESSWPSDHAAVYTATTISKFY
jgi:endonuclease/exonuclease/phosphatase family metal-dependent hydrolase